MYKACCFEKHKCDTHKMNRIKNMRIANIAIPPTTPPTIAPTGTLLLEEVVVEGDGVTTTVEVTGMIVTAPFGIVEDEEKTITDEVGVGVNEDEGGEEDGVLLDEGVTGVPLSVQDEPKRVAVGVDVVIISVTGTGISVVITVAVC